MLEAWREVLQELTEDDYNEEFYLYNEEIPENAIRRTTSP